MKIDQDWLLGTRLTGEKVVIVNECRDERLIDRVKREIETTITWRRSDLSRIRVTVEWKNDDE